MKRLIIVVGLILGIMSCKKTTEHVNMHYDYFGNTKGKFIIYDAKEINHLSVDSSIVTNYQLKTVIGDTVHDNSGNIGNKYFRFTRQNASESWTLKDVWFIILKDNQALLTEENEKFVKMVFAPTSSKIWNGNAFNTHEEIEYYFEDLHTPNTIGGHYFDSTLKVVQEEQFNLISLRRKYEVYAKNVGLIKKHYQHLNINNFNVNAVSSGKELYLTMTSYGNE